MPDLFVQRNGADLRGPDIIDPLLTTIAACLSRGRKELDDNAHALQDVTILIPHVPGLRCGQVIGEVDLFTGLYWFGKIVGIEYNYTETSLEVRVDIKRPSL